MVYQSKNTNKTNHTGARKRADVFDGRLDEYRYDKTCIQNRKDGKRESLVSHLYCDQLRLNVFAYLN